MNSILIVDDEPDILWSLAHLLNDEFQVFSALNAEQGLQILSQEKIQVVLSDYRMAGLSGVEFLQGVCELYPDTIRIILTGYADFETVLRAINQGHVYKFLMKPWNPELLKLEIQDACRVYDLILKNRELTAKLQNYASHLEQQVQLQTAELRASKEQYQALVNSLPDWIWEIDPAFHFTYCSPQSEVLIGYQPHEILKTTSFDFLLASPQIEHLRQVIENACHGGLKIVALVLNVKTKAGVVRHLETKIRLIQDLDGVILRYIGVSRDITEQKKQQELLVQHENELSLLLEASNFITTLRNQEQLTQSILQGTILAVNADSGCLFLADEISQMLTISASVGFDENSLHNLQQHFTHIPFGEKKGIVGIAAQTHTILCISHVESDPRWIPFDPSIHSAIWIPILYEDRLLGVLNVFSHQTEGFSRSSIRLGKLFANKVAIVLENIRLFNQIRDSEARYRMVVENAHDLIYILDSECKITYLNPAIERVLGYQAAQLMHTSILEIVAPEYRQTVKQAYQEILQQEKVARYLEFEIFNNQSQRHWIEQNITPFINDREIVGLQTISRDSTQRRLTEQALRVSEERYRLLVENSNDLVLLIESDGTFSFVNHRFTELTGYTAREARTLPFQALVYPDDLPLILDRHLRRFAGEKVENNDEFRIFTRDRRLLYMDATFNPILEGNQVAAIQAIVRDVTEKKQTEQALKGYEEKIRLILANLTEIVYSCDPTGGVTFISPTVEKLLKIPAAHFIGKELWTGLTGCLKTSARLASLARVRQRIIRQKKQIFTYELDLHPDDQYRTMEFSEYIQYDAQGKLLVTNGVIRDITERKQAEHNLHQTLAGVIEAISLMIEHRDPYTAGHQQNTAKIATAIGKELKLSKNRIEGLYLAAILLDVGKISIPAEILNKTSRLSEAEMSIIQTHAVLGANILSRVPWPWPIPQFIEEHHERMDGSGYPKGLSGKAIALESRILAVADTIDAMINHRPYRPAIDIDTVIQEIVHQDASKFDADILPIILKLHRRNFFKSLSNSLFLQNFTV